MSVPATYVGFATSPTAERVKQGVKAMVRAEIQATRNGDDVMIEIVALACAQTKMNINIGERAVLAIRHEDLDGLLTELQEARTGAVRWRQEYRKRGA